MDTRGIGTSRWRYSVSAALLLAITACSSLEGGRFSHEKSVPEQRLKGVPFTLNRAVPTVTRIPGDTETPDKYMVKLGYVPDRAQRFTLQLDPGWFSSADFDMNYDVNGSLTDTSAKSTDQLAQIFTSVAKLAIAAGTLDETKDDDDELVRKLTAAGDDYFAAPQAMVFDSLARRARLATRADREAWQALTQRLTTMVAEKDVRKSFFYQSREEFDVLQTLLREHRAKLQEKLKHGTEYGDYRDALKGLLGDAKTQSTARDIDVAYGQLDKRQLKKIKAAIIAERAKLRTEQEQQLYPGDGGALALNFKLRKFTSLAKLPDLESILVDIADLEHTEWQRRVVAWINKQIDDRRYVLQIGTDGSNKEAEARDTLLAELQNRKAAVLGVLEERKRRLAIQALMVRAPQAKDYDDLRAEVVALSATEAAAESSLKAKAAEPKPEESLRAEILYFSSGVTVQDSEIKRMLALQLGGLTGEKLPRYVVVLQPIALPAAVAAPSKGLAAAPAAPVAQQAHAAGSTPHAPPDAATPPPKQDELPVHTAPVTGGSTK